MLEIVYNRVLMTYDVLQTIIFIIQADDKMNEILERMASDVQALNGNTSGNYPFVLFQNN